MSEQDKKPDMKVEEGKRTFTEELEVAGSQLVEKVQGFIKEGNVRRIIVRSSDDKILLETSLTIGAAVGGVLAITALPLAMLAAIAAAVARVKIEIVREITDDAETVVEGKKKRIEIEDK